MVFHKIHFAVGMTEELAYQSNATICSLYLNQAGGGLPAYLLSIYTDSSFSASEPGFFVIGPGDGCVCGWGVEALTGTALSP